MARRCILLLVCAAAARADDPLEEARAAIEAADWTRALAIATPLAEKGDPEAQAILGRVHFSWARTNDRRLELALSWYLKAAEQGHTDSQRQAATILLTLERHAESVAWFRKAGDAASMRQVADAYRLGRGVSLDPLQAAEWYRKAAEKGDADAQRQLGTMYRDGEGVPQDAGEAERWLAMAEAQGDNLAALLIRTLPPRAEAAAQFAQGLRSLDEGKTKEAIALLDNAARARSRDAALALANLYLEGTKVPFSDSQVALWAVHAARGGRVPDVEALVWRALQIPHSSLAASLIICIQDSDTEARDSIWTRLEERADAGDATALAAMGIYHGRVADTLRAQGGDAAHESALALLNLWAAAEGGDRHARKDLWASFRVGHGTLPDLLAANGFAKAAAEDGEVWAQLGWGSALLMGEPGAPQDPAAGFGWLKKAATADDTTALMLVGACYVQGLGVEKNAELGFGWLQKAADLGHLPALQAMGALTIRGQGTQKDEVAGWAMIGRAATAGNAASIENLRLRASEGNVHALFQFGVLTAATDNEQGVAMIRKAADHGYQPAIDWLGEHEK